MVGRVYIENTKHCNILNILAEDLMALEKIFSFSHDKSMGAKDHWDIANLNPRGMVGRLYVWDH